MNSTGKRAAFVLAVTLLAALGLSAQQTNVGTVTGTVRDTSGAIIADATVVAKNQGTSLTQTVVTNTSGTYTIPLLPIGAYEVTATKSGFKTSVRTDVAVISGQTFTVDFELAIGAVTQVVTVTAAPPTLDRTSVTMATARTSNEISQLPIAMTGQAARTAAGFAKTLAGVNYDVNNSGQDWSLISRSQINGAYAGTAGYIIDGVDGGSGEAEAGQDFMSPVPEEVEEIRITNNVDSSQGFNGGVVVAMTLKSGTNQLHGDLNFYARNSAFEARNTLSPSVSKDIQNEWGFAVGGPVIIPKIYNGRNKTFFFTDMDFYRYRSAPAGQIATVPTQLMRTGDFSEVLGPQMGTDALGRPVFKNEIYDPTTLRQAGVNANGAPIFVRDPFMYGGKLNAIPPSMLSATTQNFLKGWALPTRPGFSQNWVGNAKALRIQKDQWLFKVDQLIGDKHRISFASERTIPWFQNSATDGHSGHSYIYGGPAYLTDPLTSNSFIDDRESYRFRFNYVWSISSNLLLNFRAGITRNPNRLLGRTPEKSAAGLAAGLKGTLDPGPPRTGTDDLGGTGPIFDSIIVASSRMPVSLDVSWAKGNHNYKFGADSVFLPFTAIDGRNAAGSLGFSRGTVGLPNVTGTGFGTASLLLGDYSSWSVVSPVAVRTIMGAVGLFMQDSWRVTHKLTLNYGLRWDVYLPLHSLQDRIGVFDPSIPNPGAGGRLGALSIYGKGGGRNGLHNVVDYYFKAFGPKLGIAYAYSPKTVLRASYGISYMPYWGKYYSSLGPVVPTYGFSASKNAISPDPLKPAGSWDNPFPLTFPQFPVIDPTLQNNNSIVYLDRSDNRPPMVQNIGVEVGRELPGNISLRVAYVGTMIHRIPAITNLNYLPRADLSLGSLLQANINSPAAQAAGIPIPYPGFNFSVQTALLPYPQYRGGVTNQGAQLGNSTYSALQINVQRQFGSLTFLGNYTNSKNIGNTDLGGYDGTEPIQPVYPDLLQSAKHLLNKDVSQAVNLSWVWDVPVGAGKAYLGGSKGALQALVGNWRLSAIQNYASGFPMDLAGYGWAGGSWYNLVPNQPLTLRGCGAVDPNNPATKQYLNPAAFQIPAPFTLGNVRWLNNVRTCAYLEEDLGLEKDFPIRERIKFRIGAMATNLFNRHIFSRDQFQVDTNLNDPNFGTFTGTYNYPRTVQFYGKLEF